MKRKEIEQLQVAGLISAEQAVAIAEHFHLNGGRRWNWLVLSMSTLAGGLILGGIIMLISANWTSIPDLVKMVVAMALLLGFWVAWARTRENHPRIAEGLGLVDVSILPHYQKAKNYTLDGKRLYEDITFRDSMGHTFFALPDGSYFFQDEDGLLLCGRAFRIRNSILELLTIDEEVMDMEKLI